MREIESILALAAQTAPGERLALATVVNVRGSAYRRPGARMLMNASGKTAGMISGGCLENDVQERARQVMTSCQPQLVTYDSTAPEDIVFGLGLGCNGIVQILIEPLLIDEGLLPFFKACHERRQPGSIATLFNSLPALDATLLPPRALQWPDGRITSDARTPELSAAVAATLEKPPGRVAVRSIPLLDGSTAEVLVERIVPPVPLVIFGGGDDAIPLVHFAKLLGWDVTVIDSRPAYALPERFDAADAVLCLRPESLFRSQKIAFSPETVAIIMTHSYPQDQELLRTLLPQDLRYLGILGPKARTRRLLDELTARGSIFPERTLAGLRSPAGLDLGAETPDEVALSVLAEMQAVVGCRSGGPLRTHPGPIHDPLDGSKEAKSTLYTGDSSAD